MTHSILRHCASNLTACLSAVSFHDALVEAGVLRSSVLNDETGNVLLHLYPHSVLLLYQVPVLGEGQVILGSSGEPNIEPYTVSAANGHLLQGSCTPGRRLNRLYLIICLSFCVYICVGFLFFVIIVN